MTLRLTDDQLELVMRACEPLDPSKRCVLMERTAAALRSVSGRINDSDVEHAVKLALRGLQQAPAA